MSDVSQVTDDLAGLQLTAAEADIMAKAETERSPIDELAILFVEIQSLHRKVLHGAQTLKTRTYILTHAPSEQALKNYRETEHAMVELQKKLETANARFNTQRNVIKARVDGVVELADLELSSAINSSVPYSHSLSTPFESDEHRDEIKKFIREKAAGAPPEHSKSWDEWLSSVGMAMEVIRRRFQIQEWPKLLEQGGHYAYAMDTARIVETVQKQKA